MKFSYNWLKELAGFEESPKKLSELLPLYVFEVEGVEKMGDDYVLDVSILPNRVADASGHLGFAREIASILDKEFKAPEMKPEERGEVASSTLQLKIEDPKNCPRYTARVMDGIKVGPAPAWMQERLEVCGIQSINNIVDAANYVMLETGQPLHVFDMQKLQGKADSKTIKVRRAGHGEKIVTLDDKEYELNPDILVIADEKEPIAIAGIKGGKESGVSDETTTIILESANFDPIVIRKGSRALSLQTDASHRFEHGLDPNETEEAVNRLALIIQEVAGGIRETDIVDAYPHKIPPTRIRFRPEYANNIIGQELPEEFYENIIERIGCTIKKDKDGWIAEAPTRRRDLVIEEDLVEETVRIFGYEKIAPAMPVSAALPPKQNERMAYTGQMRENLVSAGFSEALVYEFSSASELKQFGIDTVSAPMLENPLNPETAYLAPRALTKYVLLAQENLKHLTHVRLFGIAKSFSIESSKLTEQDELLIALAAKGTHGAEEFYQLKGTIDHILESFGISSHWYDDAIAENKLKTTLKFFHPYRVAEIKIGDQLIGHVGEIHPDVVGRKKPITRIVGSEIYLDALTGHIQTEQEYRPIGKYPAIIRDLAVVVPGNTRVVDILNIIENTGGNLLADTDLFDYFQDETMRDSQEKSLAFHLVFQSPKRTLTDKEIDESVVKITGELEKVGWEVRK